MKKRGKIEFDFEIDKMTDSIQNVTDCNSFPTEARRHIKEPDEVDFVGNGKTLTEKEKAAISEFIKAEKEKMA